MLFQTSEFLIFFVPFFLLYWLLPPKARKGVLLLGNIFFYCYSPSALVWAIVTSSLAVYWAAVSYKKHTIFAKIVGGVLPFGMLVAFQFAAFATKDFTPELRVLLPLGISYYTLNALGYLIDVAKGKYAAVTNPLDFCLFMTFFPQVISGPISRGAELLPQYKNIAKLNFNHNLAFEGIALFLWGLFKKMTIADRLSAHLAYALDAPEYVTGVTLLMAAVLYSIQIYLDFSAYSDMAVGIAKLLGIKLNPNFRLPYFATSMREFWSRWHMSLSAWLRDYIYIPLGGSRYGKMRLYFALFITFVVSGIWHGAGLTFLVWGVLHAFYQIFGHATQGIRKKLASTLHINEQNFFVRLYKQIYIFIIVTFAWVFFRAESLESAVYILQKIATDITFSLQAVFDAFVLMEFTEVGVITLFALILFAFIIETQIGKDKDGGEWICSLKKPQMITLCYILIFACIFFNFGEASFIYFGF